MDESKTPENNVISATYAHIIAGLNPQQRAAVSAPLGRHIKVVAGAGTGKTSVLTQRIAWLVAHGVMPWHITAVTFTNKAAREMRERLDRSIGKEKAQRVQMRTFHGLGRTILQRHHEAIGLKRNFPIIDTKEQEMLMMRVIRQQMGSGSSASIEAYHKEHPAGEKRKDGKIKLARWQESEISEQKKKEKDLASKHLAFISKWKQQAKYPPPDVPPANVAPHVREALVSYKLYEQEKKNHGGLDFDDLITRVNYLFKQRPDILSLEQARIRALLCDEFQDVNEEQSQFIRFLSDTENGKHRNPSIDYATSLNESHTTLFIVGDEDQSIYGWRGSKPELMQKFGESLNMDSYRLERNYRCSPIVLDAANAVIRNNPKREDKNLFTERPEGVPIAACYAETQREEEHWVADTIQQLVALKKGSLKDVAILYRSKSAAAGLTREMVHRGIPYKVFGDVGFYAAAEVKDALSWLRVIMDPHDDGALRRALKTPPCGIGAKTLDQWEETAEMTGASLYSLMRKEAEKQTGVTGKQPVAAFVRKLEDLQASSREKPLGAWMEEFLETGTLYGDGSTGPSLMDQHNKDGEKGEDRKENLLSLVTLAASHASQVKMNGLQGTSPDEDAPLTALVEKPEDILADFVAEMALMTAAETADADMQDAVSFMTIHKAKGLEFPHVFVIACSDGIFPMRKDNDPFGECDNMEEERRLFYVALTRSIHSLFISGAQDRMSFGNYRGLFPPSLFVKEVPDHLMTTDVREVLERLPEKIPEPIRKAIGQNAQSMTRTGENNGENNREEPPPIEMDPESLPPEWLQEIPYDNGSDWVESMPERLEDMPMDTPEWMMEDHGLPDEPDDFPEWVDDSRKSHH